MKISTLFTLVAGASASVSQTKPRDHDAYKATACFTVAQNYNFGITANYYMSQYAFFHEFCHNEPFLQTILLCMDKAYDGDMKKLQKQFKERVLVMCKFVGEPRPDKHQVRELLMSAKHSQPVENPEPASQDATAPPSQLYTKPVIVDEETYEGTLASTDLSELASDKGLWLASGLLGYWALILLFGTVSHMFRKLFFPVLLKMTGLHINTLRRNVTMSALFGHKHAQGWLAGCLPTRVQSLTVVGYWCLIFIFPCVGYKFETPTEGNSHTAQLRSFLAVRLGIMAVSQTPLIFLFAGRNNFLMWLTGWSFDTFNVYHRWIGRGMVALAISHGVTFTVAVGDALPAAYKRHWFYCGVMAVISSSFMILFAISAIRHRFYEVFLIIHLCLAIVFVYAIYNHTEFVGYHEFIYAVIAVWAFDRAARIARLFYSGINSRAKITVVDTNERIMRLEIRHSGRWTPKPGQYIFLYVLSNRKFWESHPFTVFQSPQAEKDGSITLMVKAQKGMTDTLYKRTLETGTLDTRVLVEGPYGSKMPVDKYDSSILIAGGIGITAIYLCASSLLMSSAKTITVCWVLRSDQALEYFSTELDHLLNDPRVRVEIYFSTQKQQLETSPSSTISDSESMVDNGVVTEKDGVIERSRTRSRLSSAATATNRLHISYGYRPDMLTHVPNSVASQGGSTAIVVCGPPAFSDDVRLAVRDNLNTTNERVDYFEEAFSW